MVDESNANSAEAVWQTISAVEGQDSVAGQLEVLISAVRDLCDCDHVALRLRDERGGWIPIVASSGLESSFLRDEALINELDCMCGRVMRGDVDPELDLFTSRGSFSTGHLQEVPAEYDACQLGPVRGRCIAQGIESLALLPVRAAGQNVGLLYVASKRPDALPPARLAQIENLCSIAGGALLSRSAAERERETTRMLRRALAPEPPGQVGALEIRVAQVAADGDAGLGGDFCDALEVADGKTLLLVGDIAGEGIGVAGLAARCRFTLTGLATEETDPAKLLSKANAALAGQLPEDRFATVAVASFEPRTRTLSFALAGHPEPLVFGRPGGPAAAVTAGPPLGVQERVEYETLSVPLSDDAVVVMYTDGVVDAPGPEGRFGTDGLVAACRDAAGSGASDLAERICQAAASYAQGRHTDDMLAMTARPTADT